MRSVKRFFSSLLKNNKTAAVKVCASNDAIKAADVVRLRPVATMVSPPHPVSNLREVVLRIPSDESKAEAEFRRLYAGVQSWNQDYWEKHNAAFLVEKEKYTRNRLEKLKEAGVVKENLTAEEMSAFYKQFLNDNHRKHMDYNWAWYRKNVGLLWPAFKACWARLHREGFRPAIRGD